jgi:hypothetical protein
LPTLAEHASPDPMIGQFGRTAPQHTISTIHLHKWEENDNAQHNLMLMPNWGVIHEIWWTIQHIAVLAERYFI